MLTRGMAVLVGSSCMLVEGAQFFTSYITSCKSQAYEYRHRELG